MLLGSLLTALALGSGLSDALGGLRLASLLACVGLSSRLVGLLARHGRGGTASGGISIGSSIGLLSGGMISSRLHSTGGLLLLALGLDTSSLSSLASGGPTTLLGGGTLAGVLGLVVLCLLGVDGLLDLLLLLGLLAALLGRLSSGLLGSLALFAGRCAFGNGTILASLLSDLLGLLSGRGGLGFLGGGTLLSLLLHGGRALSEGLHSLASLESLDQLLLEVDVQLENVVVDGSELSALLLHLPEADDELFVVSVGVLGGDGLPDGLTRAALSLPEGKNGFLDHLRVLLGNHV